MILGAGRTGLRPARRIHSTVFLLSRCVRFAVGAVPPGPDSRNGYAGRPAMAGLGAHYELSVRCRGDVDPTLGYMIDIQEIDRAVRAAAIPRIRAAFDEHPASDPGMLLSQIMPHLAAELRGLLDSVIWRLSPYYSVEVRMGALESVLVRQRFDFAAAHRLNVESLSPDENLRLFGKCNYPGGHGHNYQVEPCIAAPLGAHGAAIPLSALESLVHAVIIERFDHRNLNQDVEEFRPPRGVNPSVENIARVCHRLLAPEVARTFPGAELRSVTVWESDRTSSTFPA